MTALRVTWQSRWGLPLGYSIHSEELALALLARGVSLAFRPTRWPARPRIRKPALAEIAKRPPDEGVPQVSYEQADLFHVEHPGYKVGYTMLEVDGLPRDWTAACNRMDEVWVPSGWGRERFLESGVKRPVHVMPLGYDPARFSVEGPARRPSELFTFLSVFEWGERKAPDILLRAFSAAFTGREDVLLLLRVSNFDGDLDVSEEIRNLRLPEGGPKVALLYNHHIAHDTLGALYRSADAFVLPTRGEGWGMPILEAMACGLPAIATDWSGQTEFFHEGVGYPVPAKALVPADAKCPYYKGFRWAEPDFDALVAALRRVFENREEARLRGEAAAREAAARWTWGPAADRIVARLREIPGP